jgi:cell division protein FtsL
MRQKIPAGGGRSRRRRRQRSYFLQLALAASLVAAGAWLLVVVAEKVIHPYWLGHEVGQQVAQVREQVARQKARNAELRKQILFLRSEEGAEREARRRGFRRPGEEVRSGGRAHCRTAPGATRGNEPLWEIKGFSFWGSASSPASWAACSGSAAGW